MKMVHFPSITKFSELFNKIENKPIVGEKSRFICFSDNRQSMYGVLRPQFETFIKQAMMNLCNDENIYISVIIRSDKSALVTFSFNKICGSRYITEMREEDLTVA